MVGFEVEVILGIWVVLECGVVVVWYVKIVFDCDFMMFDLICSGVVNDEI